jgi:hypothetical protein
MRRIGERTAELGRTALLLLVMLSLTFAAASAGVALAVESSSGFRLIVHPDNAAVSAERQFLSDAFFKRATRWPDGVALEPVDLRFGNPARERFSEQILRRSAAAVRNYWQQRIFTGRGVPPPELDSDEVVLRYVRTHRGAVGYVSESAELGAVKLLTVH